MKVLLADDDAFFRYSLRKSLAGWGYDVVIASNGNEALEILQGVDPPRLAIMDWMMPGMHGIDVCRQLRARNTDNYVYVLLITAKSDKADIIAGLDAQADDYLVKPFNLQELRARLQAGGRIVNFQATLASRQRELSHQATHDSLTGIWNRQAIIDILERETGLVRQSKKPLCLAIADVDNFKQVNDTYGHADGDIVLTEAVRRMQSALRHFDNIGRYGGDEFIIVMPGLRLARGFKIAERLRLRVAERPYEIFKKQIPVTLSIGIAADAGAGDAGLLLRSADEALYRAKALGRNRVEMGPAELVRERRVRRRQLL